MQYELIVSIVVYKPNIDQLQQTINSLCKSSVDLKIVLADNSPLPSLDISTFKFDKPLEYHFNGENLGYGRAHNKNLLGQNKDSAKYFLVLNPDVFFDGLLLQELIKRLALHEDIGLCIPKICHPAGHIQMINRRIPRPVDYVISFLSCKLNTEFFQTPTYNRYLLKDINTDDLFYCPTVSGCFMFFRSSAFIDVGGFDERFFLYLEDTDLSRRVSEKYKTIVFSDLVAYHHWSRGAYRNLKLFINFVQSLVLYFNKWGWLRDSQRDKLNSKVKSYNLEFDRHKAYEAPVLIRSSRVDQLN